MKNYITKPSAKMSTLQLSAYGAKNCYVSWRSLGNALIIKG